MKSRPNLAVAILCLLLSLALFALILPTFANSGDYGVNTGGAQTCPPGQTWVSDPNRSTGGYCDGPTPIPPTSTLAPTATPAPPTRTPPPPRS